MSRHEMIRMFEFIMRGLFMLLYSNSNIDGESLAKLSIECKKFMKDLEFKSK